MSKRQHRQEIIQYELTGLALLALAALAMGRLGIVGRYMDIAFVYLAGSWYFFIPVFVGYAALYMMISRTQFQWTSRHVGGLVLFLTWLTYEEFTLFQYFRSLTNASPVLLMETLGRIDDIKSAILDPVHAHNTAGAGGGLLGWLFFSFTHYLLGDNGMYVLVVFGTLAGLALLTQKSLVAVVQSGTRWMEKRLERLWFGAKHYAGLLFSRERNVSAEIPDKPPVEVEVAPKRKRRKPTLIVDGEVVSEGVGAAPWNEAEHPIVRDFSAHVSESTSTGSVTPMEQIGNRLVMRYSDATMSDSARAKADTPTDEYVVGAPVRDENYQLPPIHLFSPPQSRKGAFDQKSAQENARKLEMTLESFGVQTKVLEISRGPAVTRYELQPAVGVKVSRIVSLADDIALALAARDIRIEAPVPGKPVVGIEVPNDEIAVVSLREVLESPEFQSEENKLSIAFGRDISGRSIIGNLQKMPHLLVAGATGSGKSVCINGIIASVLVKAKPHEVKFLMIDPKMVELSQYNGIPHLVAPVVTDPKKAAFALRKIVQEMEGRYRAFADRGARDIERYNQLLRADGADPLPYIVVIIDELADLMMVAPGDVEDAICRIAQMARAAGIHLIVATQRPSVDVITGVIKANIPSRIAFAVSSMADSRTILDSGGAEKLLGRGDMLYWPVGASKSVRVQGAYVSEQEMERLIEYVKNQQNAVYIVDLNHGGEAAEDTSTSELDDLFLDAVDLVVDSGQASVSMLQRRFRIGYSRAARIVDQMELKGIIGPFEGSKPRELRITREQWHAMKQGTDPKR